jgi:hypothetical protein
MVFSADETCDVGSDTASPVSSAELNAELLATYANLDGARNRLSDFQYVAYVAIVLERVVKESERLAFGEALRTRDWKRP